MAWQHPHRQQLSVSVRGWCARGPGRCEECAPRRRGGRRCGCAGWCPRRASSTGRVSRSPNRERREREGVQRHGPERRCGHGPATGCVRTSTTPSAQRIPTAVLCTRDDACKGESGSVSLSCMNRPNVVLGGTEQRRGESTRTAARAPAVIYRLCGILDLEHLAIWAVRRAAQIVARADGRHGCKLRESGGGSWPWAA
jgi:hypothetical protein